MDDDVVRELLDKVARELASIVGGTAADDKDVLDATEFILCHIDATELHAVTRYVDTTTEG